MPKSMTLSARMRWCSASISGTSSRALGLGGQHPQQPLAGAAVALIRTGRQRVHKPFQLDMGVAQLVGVDEVLGQLTRQPQHHRGDSGRCLVGVQHTGIFA